MITDRCDIINWGTWHHLYFDSGYFGYRGAFWTFLGLYWLSLAQRCKMDASLPLIIDVTLVCSTLPFDVECVDSPGNIICKKVNKLLSMQKIRVFN